MKTPEEIKTELKDALPVHFHKGDPEPRLTPFNYHALEFLHTDALAYIRQLEAEVKKYEEGYDALTKIVKRLEAERDAAVADLAHCTASHCPFCKNWRNPEKAAVCFSCRYGRARRFEWRGVQKEEAT